MGFNTFSLLEDRCVRLLVRNLGKRMPESVSREDLESLYVPVQGSCSSDPAAATRTPPKTVLPSHQWREDMRRPRSEPSPSSASDGGDVRDFKKSTALYTLPALRTHAA